MSSSPSTVLNLTLDLNSQAHAPPAGVLKTLDLVAGAPHDFDLHLRVVHGSSVLKFSFNGLEDAPARATVELPDLDGSTKTPEIYERQSVRDEIMNIDEQRLSQSNNDNTESVVSDEPLATQKRPRRKPLHHNAVGNDSYGETSDENSTNSKSHKRRHLRRKRPAPGSYIEPPKDGRDIFESDAEIFNPPHTNTPRSNVKQAPYTPTPQKKSREIRFWNSTTNPKQQERDARSVYGAGLEGQFGRQSDTGSAVRKAVPQVPALTISKARFGRPLRQIGLLRRTIGKGGRYLLTNLGLGIWFILEQPLDIRCFPGEIIHFSHVLIRRIACNASIIVII